MAGPRRPVEVHANRVRRNPWLRALGFAPLLLIPLLAMVAIANGDWKPMLGTFHAVAFTLAASMILHRRNFRPRFDPIAVEVDDDTLHLGDEQVPLADVKNAYLAPGGNHTRVRIDVGRTKEDLEVAVTDWNEGSEVLDAMGFGVSQMVSRFRTMSQAHSSPWKVAAGMIGAVMLTGILSAAAAQLGPAALPIAPLLMAILGATFLLAPTHLDIGADGLATRWLGRKRFYGYDAIQTAVVRTGGMGRNRVDFVDVHLRDGTVVKLPVEQSQWKSGKAAAVHARLMAALAAHQSGTPVAVQALAKRDGRDPIDWVKALQSALEGGALRHAAVSAEALWATVGDARASGLDRATAAVALGRELGAPEREKLKRVAASVASPKLRIAIDSVAEQQEAEAIAEALAAVEEEEARA